MKTNFLISTALGCFLAVISTSCQVSEKKVEEAKEEVNKSQQELNKAQEDYKIEYQKFKLESENKILDNEKKINELKEKKMKVNKENRLEYEEKIKDLEKKNNELKAKINNYQYADMEKWESFKNEFTHDMDEIGKAIKDLFNDNVKD